MCKADSNKTDLFKKRFLSSHLKYDISNEWEKFQKESIRDLFLKIEENVLPLVSDDNLQNEQIEDFMILLCYNKSAVLRVDDFLRPLEAASDNLHGYMLNMSSYTLESVRLKIKKYVSKKRLNEYVNSKENSNDAQGAIKIAVDADNSSTTKNN